jgi:YtoQ family protein
MTLHVYLSGEIHTDWRDQIIDGAAGLDVVFTGPVTDHAASDDCGVAILGAEENKFWQGHRRGGCRRRAFWRSVQTVERGF